MALSDEPIEASVSGGRDQILRYRQGMDRSYVTRLAVVGFPLAIPIGMLSGMWVGDYFFDAQTFGPAIAGALVLPTVLCVVFAILNRRSARQEANAKQRARLDAEAAKARQVRDAIESGALDRWKKQAK